MKDTRDVIRVEVSYKTILFAVAILIGLWFLVYIKEIIILVFISIILLSALLRPVDWLTSKRIPRALSALLVYLAVIALISTAITIIFPPLISQTTEFGSRFPQIISSVNDFLIFNKIPVEDLASIIGRQTQQIAGNLISISTAIFSSIFLILTVFVFTFYLLLEWKSFVRLASSPFSGKQERLVASIISKVERGLGQWVRGQLSLSFIIGVLTYTGLTILGIPFALPLALIAGILEIVPIIGPIIASIPAILVGLTVSPILALAVAALFLIIQQLENNLIVPMIMSKVVGLQPPVVMIALLIGTKLAGIGGAFLAIPLIIVIKIIVKELMTEDKKLDEAVAEV